MILNNVQLVGGDKPVSIRVSDGKIAQVSDVPLSGKSAAQLIFTNAIIFPGLINSHDHLDFNLFPQLGNKTYNSYTEWGKYIHENYPAEIAACLKIPVALREQWGIYKNLLCGVTTIVNHGNRKGLANQLITVFEKKQDLHSVRLEKDWKKRLNNPLKLNLPAVIHIGEGTNANAHDEIDELIRWNILRRKLIGVHGVAMSPAQARAFKALIWCPQSNYFLLNKTAPVSHLKKYTPILFGTDSTLTGHWDIWEHIRTARKTGLLTDDELYQSLSTTPAAIWKLNSGAIEEGRDADLVVARATKPNSMDSFYNTTPEDLLLVMHQGNIRLFDETLYHQLSDIPRATYQKVYSSGSIKYVQGDLHLLLNEIRQYKADVHFPVYLPSEPAA
jgi:cytosine/adenosine deaminase-related metal-dependent hydrolase